MPHATMDPDLESWSQKKLDFPFGRHCIAFLSPSSPPTMFRYLLLLSLLIQTISGFAPTQPRTTPVATFRPANFVSAAAPTSARTPFIALRMASSDGEDDSSAVDSKISGDGTFYDDEVRMNE